MMDILEIRVKHDEVFQEIQGRRKREFKEGHREGEEKELISTGSTPSLVCLGQGATRQGTRRRVCSEGTVPLRPQIQGQALVLCLLLLSWSRIK